MLADGETERSWGGRRRGESDGEGVRQTGIERWGGIVEVGRSERSRKGRRQKRRKENGGGGDTLYIEEGMANKEAVEEGRIEMFY